jgi:hypothetical protein
MSLTDAMARVAQIQQLTVQVVPVAPPDAVERRITTGSAPSSFTSALAQAQTASSPFPGALAQVQTASSPYPFAATVQPGGGTRALAWAQSQIGQTENPPGSNDGPAIATYRSAVAGAQAGQPWCAYFASWAAAQAGTPLGDSGQGIGWVDGIKDWAQRNGKLLPAGSTPQPGDLILYGGRHVGIVESVATDGSLTTVEGNEGDAVKRVHRAASEATGFVRL